MPTVEEMLATARERLERLGPEETAAALEAGTAILIDIRPYELRSADGTIPGAVTIGRNVLEWRCDPAGSHRDERVSDTSKRLIVTCDEGYTSSLAAAILQDLGHTNATDLDGGFQAWRATGLPVQEPETS